MPGELNFNYFIFCVYIKRGTHQFRCGHANAPGTEEFIIQLHARCCAAQGNGFQDIGLAATVFTDQYIEPTQFQVQLVDGFEVFNRDVFYHLCTPVDRRHLIYIHINSIIDFTPKINPGGVGGTAGARPPFTCRTWTICDAGCSVRHGNISKLKRH